MTTSKAKTSRAFSIWITGLPASGKSTITRALVRRLSAYGVHPAVLESDVLRRVLTPRARYDEAERREFYAAMVYIGVLLIRHGISVIFDATANRRAYRQEARDRIDRFLEVYVDAPLSLCMERDPKGIYQKGISGDSGTVPGLQSGYEPPHDPDVVVHADRESPAAAARKIMNRLVEKKFIAEKERRGAKLRRSRR